MNETWERFCAVAFVVPALLLATGIARGDIFVGFDQDEYIVTSVNEPFSVQVLIDANDQTPELDPIRGGLFSFGTKFTFDATKAQINNASGTQSRCMSLVGTNFPVSMHSAIHGEGICPM